MTLLYMSMCVVEPSRALLQATTPSLPCATKLLHRQVQTEPCGPRSILPRDPRKIGLRKRRDCTDEVADPLRVLSPSRGDGYRNTRSYNHLAEKRKEDRTRCDMENMTNAHVKQGGWTAASVKEGAEWSTRTEEGADKFMKEWSRRYAGTEGTRHAIAAAKDAPGTLRTVPIISSNQAEL